MNLIEAYWYVAPIFIWCNGAFLAGGEQSDSLIITCELM
jgi:hypothetical protein